jgi:hypothetical protein
MGIYENGSLVGCTSVYLPKTSPIQTAEGGYFDALNYYYSLNTQNKTPENVWEARTDICYASGRIQPHNRHTPVCL